MLPNKKQFNFDHRMDFDNENDLIIDDDDFSLLFSTDELEENMESDFDIYSE